MKKSSFSKAYDVKTFLNKKKTASRFFLFTFSNKITGTIAGILTLVVFMMILHFAFSVTGVKEEFSVYVVNCAVPAYCTDNDQNGFDIENFFLSITSPFVDFKLKNEPPSGKSKQDIVIPKVEINDETVYTNGIEIKNETEYPVDSLSILAQGTEPFSNKHKVLIVHTHGSESYTPDKRDFYENTGNYRTRNSSYNVIRVGEELAGALKEKGIAVIHDKTINDYPSYNDSYNKTGKLITGHLEEHQDIAFVFDIHRDAVGTGDKIVKFTSEIQGKTAAQVMIVCGTDTNLANPNWRDNLRLAVCIQDYFSQNYPGFLRPINLRKERFNMHLTTGSLLFEIGTNGNSLREALHAARILGYGLGDFININKTS